MYDLWHFVIKYLDFSLAFNIKIFHGGEETMEVHGKHWAYAAKCLDWYVYLLDIPKWLARCWEPACDFALLQAQDVLNAQKKLQQHSTEKAGVSSQDSASRASKKTGKNRAVKIGNRKTSADKADSSLKLTDLLGSETVDVEGAVAYMERVFAAQNQEQDELWNNTIQSGLGMWVNFCNVSVRIVNLPVTLSQSVEDMIAETLGSVTTVDPERKSQKVDAPAKCQNSAGDVSLPGSTELINTLNLSQPVTPPLLGRKSRPEENTLGSSQGLASRGGSIRSNNSKKQLLAQKSSLFFPSRKTPS